MKKRHLPTALTFLYFFLAATAGAADDPPENGEKKAPVKKEVVVQPIAASLPSGAFAYAETSGFAELLRTAHGSEFYQTISQSEGMKEFMESEDSNEFRSGIKWAETIMRMDLWEAGEKLFGGRAAFALYPNPEQKKDSEEKPHALIVIEPADEKAWSKQRIWTDPLLALGATRVSRGKFVWGTKVYETKPKDPSKPKTFFALHRKRVMMASTLELLERGLNLHQPKPVGDSLVKGNHLKEFEKRLPGEHLARVFVDTKLISSAAGGRLGLPEKMDNPMGSLMFGGMLELVAHSDLACMALNIDGDQFSTQIALDAKPDDLDDRFDVFFTGEGKPARRIPQVPGLIGGVTMHRDLATWYQSRDDLLQAQVLPGFDKFETGLGNILPGKDIGEDVIPLIGKNFTLLSAVQDYDYLDGEPGVKLPGFAMVIDLAQPDPDAGEDMFQLFFQTFLSILNLQAAEQNRQPWLIAAQVHNDTQVTYARYFEKPKGEQLPTVFNFLPAAARVGDQYIISSSLGLCEDLIDTLKKEPEDSGSPAMQHSQSRVDFSAVAKALEKNRQHLIASRLNEGRDAEQAKEDIEHLFMALGHLGEMTTEGKTTADGYQYKIEGTLK